MAQTLSDFTIETDNSILLLFKNGDSKRVSRNDLAQYLASDDLSRIEHAFSLRHQFIKRVLPPTLMVALTAGIIGMSGYEGKNMSNLMHHGASGKPAQTVRAKAGFKPSAHVQVQTQPAPVQSAPAQADSRPEAGPAGTSQQNQSNQVQADRLPAQATDPVAPVAQGVTKFVKPVLDPVQQALPLNILGGN
jgi:hypothetical protein